MDVSKLYDKNTLIAICALVEHELYQQPKGCDRQGRARQGIHPRIRQVPQEG